MKWELIALGVSWTVFLVKLYQQYRRSNQDYLLIKKEQQRLHDSLRLSLLPEIESQRSKSPSDPNVERDACAGSSQALIEGQNVEVQLSGKTVYEKKQEDLDQTADDYVVFPQLYPHLRKSKHIKKSTEGEKRQKQLTKKRQTKKYKDWFLTNRLLLEIKSMGFLNEEQLRGDYRNLANEVRDKGLASRNSETLSDGHSEVSEIIFVSDKSRKKQTEKREEKILDELSDEDQGISIQKYDPFA